MNLLKGKLRRDGEIKVSNFNLKEEERGEDRPEEKKREEERCEKKDFEKRKKIR